MAEAIQQEQVNEGVSDLLEQLNARLGGMPYKLALVNPLELRLAGKNARYMRSETFQSLIQNIREDGNLSSVPFCYRDPEGFYYVLSGNHRVKAAIEAGVEKVLIFYRDDLDHDRRLAIQLSHNAIEGEDDMAILKELWASIEDLDMKIYAGLDSSALGEMEKIEFQAIKEERLDYKSVAFLFLPEELERAVEVFDQVRVLFRNEELFIMSMEHWDRFFSMMSDIKSKEKITNSATAFGFLLDLAEDGLKGRLEHDRT